MPLSDRYMKYLQLLNVYELRQECRYYGKGQPKLLRNHLIELINEIDVAKVNQREREIFGETQMRANWATQKFDLRKIEKKGQFQVNYSFEQKHMFEILEEEREKVDEEFLKSLNFSKEIRSWPVKLFQISQLQNDLTTMSKRAIKFFCEKLIQRHKIQLSKNIKKQDETQKGNFIPDLNSQNYESKLKLLQTLTLSKAKVLKYHSQLLFLPRDLVSPQQVVNDITILSSIQNMAIFEKKTNPFERVLTLVKNNQVKKIQSLLDNFLFFITSQTAFCESVISEEQVTTIAILLRYFLMQLLMSKLLNVQLCLTAVKLLCLLRAHTFIWSVNAGREKDLMQVHQQYLKILIYIDSNLNRVDSSSKVVVVLQLISEVIQVKKSLTELVRRQRQSVGVDTNENYFAERYRAALEHVNLMVEPNIEMEFADLFELSPDQSIVEQIIQIFDYQKTTENFLKVSNFESESQLALGIFSLSNYVQLPQTCIEYTIIKLQQAAKDNENVLSLKICSGLIKQLYILNRIQNITELFVVKIWQDWSYHRSILREKDSSEEAMLEIIKLLWIIFEYKVDNIVFSGPYAFITNKMAGEVAELLQRKETQEWFKSDNVSKLVIDKFKQIHKDLLPIQ